MDKSWICEISLNKEKYIREVIDFLDFPFERSSKDEKILCPCTKCVNYKWRSQGDVYKHIINHGFLKRYINWIFHGEQVGSSNFVRTPQGEEEFDHDMDILIYGSFIHVDLLTFYWIQLI